MGKTINRDDLRSFAKEALKNLWKQERGKTAKLMRRFGKGVKWALFGLGTVLCGVAGAVLIKSGPVSSMALLLADGACFAGYCAVEKARSNSANQPIYVKTLKRLMDELKRSPDEIVEISFDTYNALKKALPKTHENKKFLRELSNVERVEKTQVQMALEEAIESIAMVVKETISQEEFQTVCEAVGRAAEKALGKTNAEPENGLRDALGAMAEARSGAPMIFSQKFVTSDEQREKTPPRNWSGKW